MYTPIYRYVLTYTFCGQKNEREYSSLQTAAENALSLLNRYGNDSTVADSFSIKEVEYASERNLSCHFSLQTCYIWSNSFNGIEDLKVLAGESEEDGSRFTYGGNSLSMREYANLARSVE